MTIRDFMKGHHALNIVCPIKGKVVRELDVMGENVRINANPGAGKERQEIYVPLDTELTYEAWCMDRGSILFSCPEFPRAKLCTEWDIVRFDDNSEARATHPDGAFS